MLRWMTALSMLALVSGCHCALPTISCDGERRCPDGFRCDEADHVCLKIDDRDSAVLDATVLDTTDAAFYDAQQAHDIVAVDTTDAAFLDSYQTPDVVAIDTIDAAIPDTAQAPDIVAVDAADAAIPDTAQAPDIVAVDATDAAVPDVGLPSVVWQATATGDTDTNHESYTQLEGMSISPGTGNHLVWFSGSMEAEHAAMINAALFADGSQLLHTERALYVERSIPYTPMTMVTHAYVADVRDSEAIDVRWQIDDSSYDATAHARTLLTYGVRVTEVAQAIASNETETTSDSYTSLDNMGLTPGAGDYLVWFSGSIQGSEPHSEQHVSLFVSGVQVAHTERLVDQENSLGDTYLPVALHAKVSGLPVGGVVDVRWRTSEGTASMRSRTLTAYRIAAADAVQASATADVTDRPTSYTLVDRLTATPGAGDYLVWFSATMEGTQRDDYQHVALFANDALIPHTARDLFLDESLDDTWQSFPIATHALVQGLGDDQSIDVRWYSSGGEDITMHERTLVVYRLKR